MINRPRNKGRIYNAISHGPLWKLVSLFLGPLFVFSECFSKCLWYLLVYHRPRSYLLYRKYHFLSNLWKRKITNCTGGRSYSIVVVAIIYYRWFRLKFVFFLHSLKAHRICMYNNGIWPILCNLSRLFSENCSMWGRINVLFKFGRKPLKILLIVELLIRCQSTQAAFDAFRLLSTSILENLPFEILPNGLKPKQKNGQQTIIYHYSTQDDKNHFRVIKTWNKLHFSKHKIIHARSQITHI